MNMSPRRLIWQENRRFFHVTLSGNSEAGRVLKKILRKCLTTVYNRRESISKESGSHAAIFRDGLFSVPASLGDLTVVQRGFFTPWASTMAGFELQGHRGARGLKPENTLPSFEMAFDVGVSSVETDLQLTSDDMLVLFHDEAISENVCRLVQRNAASAPATRPL